jgi:hypothetical protein
MFLLNRRFKFSFALVFFSLNLCISSAAIAQSDNHSSAKAASNTSSEIQDLRNRLDQLELRQREAYLRSTESKGGVKTYLGDSLAIGGFFETAVTQIGGPSTPSQLSASSNELGLNFTADFAENLRFTAQILTGLSFPLDNPNGNPNIVPDRGFHTFSYGAIVPQAYIEYTRNEMLIAQTGLGYVPFGQAFQQRELVLFARRGGPQMINSGSLTNVGIANPLWMGGHIFGTTATAQGRWGYDLYTHSAIARPNSLGVGGRVWRSHSDRMTYGYSVQQGTLKEGSYVAQGLDFSMKADRFSVIVEGAHNLSSTGDTIAHSFYIEPSYSFKDDEFLIFAAADYLDDAQHTTPTAVAIVPDAYRQWLYGVGFNWIPVTFTRYRIGLFKHDYVGDTAVLAGHDRDYYSLDLSAGIAF